MNQQGYDICALAIKEIQQPSDILLYIQINLLKDDEGEWALSSLNLIDPCLYFKHNKDAGYVLAHNILDKVVGKGIKPFEWQEKIKKSDFSIINVIMIMAFIIFICRLEYNGLDVR